mmetsp:Transcript_64202/g.165257  ORF Transcript_64202/g.165257 Transcript_64202/m.165257 type:complete len:345 (+) Transcript_64202:393-1427(+)
MVGTMTGRFLPAWYGDLPVRASGPGWTFHMPRFAIGLPLPAPSPLVAALIVGAVSWDGVFPSADAFSLAWSPAPPSTSARPAPSPLLADAPRSGPLPAREGGLPGEESAAGVASVSSARPPIAPPGSDGVRLSGGSWPPRPPRPAGRTGELGNRLAAAAAAAGPCAFADSWGTPNSCGAWGALLEFPSAATALRWSSGARPTCTSVQQLALAAARPLPAGGGERPRPFMFKAAMKRALRSRLPWKAAMSASLSCSISCWTMSCMQVGSSINFTDLTTFAGTLASPLPGRPPAWNAALRSAGACSRMLASRSASPSPTETMFLYALHSRLKLPTLKVMGACIGFA